MALKLLRNLTTVTVHTQEKKCAITSLLIPERRLNSTAFDICKMAKHAKPSHCFPPLLPPPFPLAELVNNTDCHGLNGWKKLMQVRCEHYTTSGRLTKYG
jgi:hypothetical protein